MGILLFCGNRPNSIKVIEEIVASNVRLIACVSTCDNLIVKNFCEKNNLQFYTSNDIESHFLEIYQSITSEDYLISYLYPSIISNNYIDLFQDKCINFHPSPLPEHRGVAGCCFSLLEEYKYWGVTAHQLIEKVDAGDIIDKLTFDINPSTMFATDVEKITQIKLFELFKIVFEKLKTNNLSFRKQELINKLYTRKQLQQEKEFSFTDSVEVIHKKIKALWLPPYQGLTIDINNQKFTLINDAVLLEIHKLYENQKSNDSF